MAKTVTLLTGKTPNWKQWNGVQVAWNFRGLWECGPCACLNQL